jgi:hypothetical protein
VAEEEEEEEEAGAPAETATNATAEAEEPPADDQAPEPGEPVETGPAAPPDAPPADEPPVRVATRELFKQIRQARELAGSVRSVLQDAEAAGAEIMQPIPSKRAAEIVLELSRILEELKAKQRKVEKLVADTVPVIAKIDAIAGDILAAREAEERERLERERLEREREEREARERERLALVEADLEQVRALRMASELKLKQQAYADLLRTLPREAENLQTEEGKQALRVLIDQCERLESLKQFLARQLTATPYSWGWIQGSSPVDILSATGRHIKLRDRLVPWNRVGIRQMLHLCRRYIRETNRSVPLRELGLQALGAAVYCHVNGGHEAAQQYAAMAVSLSSRLKEDAARLVPVVEAEPEPQPEPEPPDGADPPEEPPLVF